MGRKGILLILVCLIILAAILDCDTVRYSAPACSQGAEDWAVEVAMAARTPAP
jgi:hypothetical protein